MGTTILVTGANGQIGSDLVEALRARHGSERVVASDVQPAPEPSPGVSFEVLDVTDRARLEATVEARGVDVVFHLASLLSARGEAQPERSWAVNVDGLRNVLDLARARGLQVFWPSSIAVFGPEVPRHRTPQEVALNPTTIYGITKVTGEMLCAYYAERFGVDVRALRFPGLVSYSAPPGGGTTDYAVEMLRAAAAREDYTCFVRADTRLPMMYMPDAIQATLELMDAAPERVRLRRGYNVAAVSFSAEALAEAIRRHVPGFTCRYEPDVRQAIADSWPASIDDARARDDWGWRPRYDLVTMVEDALEKLSERETARRDMLHPKS